MKSFFYPITLFFFLFSISCSDNLAESENKTNVLTAEIDGTPWVATTVYTQRSLNENGPLTIVAEGEGYTMEIILGGINKEGEYEMGTNRTGIIKYGNNLYTTLDVQNAGKINISSFSDQRIKGQFFFDAQWLSANNRILITAGTFDVKQF